MVREPRSSLAPAPPTGLPFPPFLASLLLIWLSVGASALAHERPSVVVTQKPLALLVAELAGESVELVQLIPDGTSPHEFNLGWSGRRLLLQSDLVVWGGEMLEPQLAGVIEELSTERTFDASLGELNWVSAADCHDHSHDHGNDDHHHHHHGAAAGGDDSCLDPHFWFNPANMMQMAQRLVGRLVDTQAIPEGQAEARLLAFTARLEAADASARQRLEPLADRYFVVEHDAYNHFTHHYGLSQPGFLRVGHGTPLGPRSLARLMERRDIVCVFTEPEYPPDLARRLAARTGAGLMALDPLGSEVPLDEGYTGFLTRFVADFAGCLEGD